MDEALETLKRLGCDVDGTLDRLVGDEDLYLSLLGSFFGGGPLEIVSADLASNDLPAASASSHSLKGVTLNLGLGPLADSAVRLNDLLKQGHLEEAKLLLADMEGSFASFYQEIKPYLETKS